jgi:translation initiation factor eIF-2B subunit alpha
MPYSALKTNSSSFSSTKPSSAEELLNMHVDMDVNVRVTLNHIMQQHPQISAPIAAIKVLLEIIRHSKATTMSEFMETIKLSSQILKESTEHLISVSAGCDLFMRFVTLTSHDLTEFQTCKDYLLNSGNFVVEKALTQKRKIVEYSQNFIQDGGVILVHSYSRVVMLILETAISQRKSFRVYVTESRPSNSGRRFATELKNLGIPVTIIVDSAVGYIMEKIDFVLVGAEGVVENGGLINSIGTYQIAMIAQSLKKPFYAAVESFKFVRLFPLNQYDLPLHKTCFPADVEQTTNSDEVIGPQDEWDWHPTVDYTPPKYITLLFTDLGALTPSGVSDELIKLY